MIVISFAGFDLMRKFWKLCHPPGSLSRGNSKPRASSHTVEFHPVVNLQKAGQHLRACRSPWAGRENAGPCSGPGNGEWAREDHPTGVGTSPPADRQSHFIAPQIGMPPASPCQSILRSRKHLRARFVRLILLKLFFCRGRL